MSKIVTKENALIIINKICEENNYTFLGFCDKDGNDCEWYGCETKLNLHCNKCNYNWKTTSFYLFKNGVKCRKCNAKNIRKKAIEKFENVLKNNIDLICKNKNYRFIEICDKNGEKSEWISVRDSYLKIECLECGKIWNITYDNLRSGKGCPRCAKYKTSKTYFSEIKKILG